MVGIGFASVVPGCSHMVVVVDIPGKQVLGEHNLGKVGIPVGEDLDKAGILSIDVVGRD